MSVVTCWNVHHHETAASAADDEASVIQNGVAAAVAGVAGVMPILQPYSIPVIVPVAWVTLVTMFEPVILEIWYALLAERPVKAVEAVPVAVVIDAVLVAVTVVADESPEPRMKVHHQVTEPSATVEAASVIQMVASEVVVNEVVEMPTAHPIVVPVVVPVGTILVTRLEAVILRMWCAPWPTSAARAPELEPSATVVEARLVSVCVYVEATPLATYVQNQRVWPSSLVLAVATK